MACPVNCAKMSTPVDIMRYAETPDDRGGQTRIWTVIESPFAEVIDKSGREQMFGAQVRAAKVYQLNMRYTDVTEKDKIRIGAVEFNIRSVFNIDFKNQYLKLVVETGVAQ